jgi:hypothetical protein
MPSLGGATEWLNSGPLGPAGLHGHVVLVNFWTLTCINWMRQEPYVRAWSRAYRADGLVVIGVHTPEFSFEHETVDFIAVSTGQRPAWSVVSARIQHRLSERNDGFRSARVRFQVPAGLMVLMRRRGVQPDRRPRSRQQSRGHA